MENRFADLPADEKAKFKDRLVAGGRTVAQADEDIALLQQRDAQQQAQDEAHTRNFIEHQQRDAELRKAVDEQNAAGEQALDESTAKQNAQSARRTPFDK